MPRRSPLTEQELEILKIAWEREAITVRDIDEALLERRKVAYTALKKTLADRAYIYRRPRAVRLGLLACISAFYSPSPKHSDGFGVKSC